MKNCGHQQGKSYRNAQRHASRFNALMCQKSLSRQIRSYFKKLTASGTNRMVMHIHMLLVTLHCCDIHCCLDKSDRIAKSPIASRTNRITMRRNVLVAPMRCCVITCCLDKSHCIGIETCYLFHCAAVLSPDIFGTAISIVFYWSCKIL